MDNKKNRLPQIEQKISSYLMGENGRITKKDMTKIGMILGTVAVATIATTKIIRSEINPWWFSPKEGITVSFGGTSTGVHPHHGSHGEHASHDSHGSHCNGPSCACSSHSW